MKDQQRLNNAVRSIVVRLGRGLLVLVLIAGLCYSIPFAVVLLWNVGLLPDDWAQWALTAPLRWIGLMKDFPTP